MTRAPFVTFEGIEGSGKTTQVRLLSGHLAAKGVPHLVTREPGGTPLADEIRALLLSPRDETVAPEAELLLYEAARAQHVRAVIRPALAGGTAVLCDRFCDATVAYQGIARGVGRERVEGLNALASGGLLPDLTLLFDVPAETGIARASGRGDASDRLESEPLRFHRAVRDAYLRIARESGGRVVAIDGGRDPGTVFRDVLAAVSPRFGW